MPRECKHGNIKAVFPPMTKRYEVQCADCGHLLDEGETDYPTAIAREFNCHTYREDAR